MRINRDAGVSVEQGQVIVNEIGIIRSSRNMVYLEGDCHSKYFDPEGYDGTSIFLGANEHSLKVNREAGFTRITLPSRCRGWDFLIATGRYDFRIAAIRPARYRRRRRALWRRPDWE